LKDKNRVGHKIEDDGSFFISYEDFCKYYTSIEVCRVFFPEHYMKQVFSGEFSKQLNTSGSYAEPIQCPQYYLECKGNSKQYVCISLIQSDRRMVKNNKSSTICIGIRVWKANDNSPVKNYTNFLKGVPLFDWSREVVLELDLEPGKYIIIPCVHQVGMESPFWIRVFSDNLFSLSQIHPNQHSKNYLTELQRNQVWVDEFKTIKEKGYQQMKMLKRKENTKLITKQIQNEQKTIKLETSNTFGFSTPVDLTLSNQQLTLLHGLNSICARTVFGNQEYVKGKHFFSVKIDSTTVPSNIMIGVSDPNVQTNLNIFLSHHFRGWVRIY
jgi:hypothetical protein